MHFGSDKLYSLVHNTIYIHGMTLSVMFSD
jgi:hypothetical protein